MGRLSSVVWLKIVYMVLRIGDTVRVKSLDWYNRNKTNYGEINFESTSVIFSRSMQFYCGRDATIIGYVTSSYIIGNGDNPIKGYRLNIDSNDSIQPIWAQRTQHTWTNEMLDSVKIMRYKKLEKIRRVNERSDDNKEVLL